MAALRSPAIHPNGSDVEGEHAFVAQDVTALEALLPLWRDSSPPVEYANFMRVALLLVHGGLFVDADTLLLRDLSLLLDMGAEFAVAWSSGPLWNNAFMRFNRNSMNIRGHFANLVSIRTFRARRWPPFGNLPDHLRPLRLPAAFTDPFWTVFDNADDGLSSEFSKCYGLRTFSDFFSKAVASRQLFRGAFAFHWHNCWKVAPVPQSYIGKWIALYDTWLEHGCMHSPSEGAPAGPLSNA